MDSVSVGESIRALILLQMPSFISGQHLQLIGSSSVPFLSLCWTCYSTFSPEMLSLKSLWGTFNWLWNSLHLTLMISYLHNWDHQWGHWRLLPVFCNASARPAQSAETLWNALQHTDRKTQFVVYEHDLSAVYFFIIDGWKQDDIFT